MMDEVDRLRLKVLHAAAEEARGFDRLNGALLELGDRVLAPQDRQLLLEYANAADAFGKKRAEVLDAMVKPYLERMREGML